MIIGKYYIFFKLVLSVWSLMCILHLQDISVWNDHTSSAQEPQRAGGCHIRQHEPRPSTLLTCLILKTTCTTGTHVHTLKPLLFPLDLPTTALPCVLTLWKDLHWWLRAAFVEVQRYPITSKTLLRNCPLQVGYRMKNQTGQGYPSHSRATWPWHFPPCTGEMHPGSMLHMQLQLYSL